MFNLFTKKNNLRTNAYLTQESIEKLINRYGEIVKSLDDKEQKYLDHITTVLDRLEDQINVVYDIGANNGMWSEAFAMYTGTDVYAFEPIEEMLNELKRRQSRNPRIKIVPFALGDKTEDTVIHVEKKVAASSILGSTQKNKDEFPQYSIGDTLPQNIKIVRLDDWKKENNSPIPSLIKIDVQGFESKVIAGGLETIKEVKYLWLELNFVDMYQGGSTYNNLNPMLFENGFELIDCVDLVRSKKNDQLLYMDGIFINKKFR